MAILVIRGCYEGVHGYGAHLRSHLRLLEKEGIPFQLLKVDLDPNVVETDEIKRWRRYEVSLPPTGAIIINFLEACYYEFFQGCYHIGYTMWETSELPQRPESENSDLAWAERMNRCDEIWTGSRYAKTVFEKAGIRKPITVVPWLLSTHPSTFTPQTFEAYKLPVFQFGPNLHKKVRPIFRTVQQLPLSLRKVAVSLGYFLFQIIHWVSIWIAAVKLMFKKEQVGLDTSYFTMICANTFNERKNYKDLFSGVSTSFQNKRARLIIKTYHAVDSWWMRSLILTQMIHWIRALKIQGAPDIYVSLNPLSDNEFQNFLHTGDVFVNTSKGEGIGGGLLLSMSIGKPAVTHTFSSMADFCSEKNSYIYGHHLEPVCWHFNFYGMGQSWARIHMESFGAALKEAYSDWASQSPERAQKSRSAKEAIQRYSDPTPVVQLYRRLIA